MNPPGVGNFWNKGYVCMVHFLKKETFTKERPDKFDNVFLDHRPEIFVEKARHSALLDPKLETAWKIPGSSGKEQSKSLSESVSTGTIKSLNSKSRKNAKEIND
jgi:hypothetical protein